jgi:hypothetical protein
LHIQLQRLPGIQPVWKCTSGELEASTAQRGRANRNRSCPRRGQRHRLRGCGANRQISKCQIGCADGKYGCRRVAAVTDPLTTYRAHIDLITTRTYYRELTRIGGTAAGLETNLEVGDRAAVDSSRKVALTVKKEILPRDVHL